MYLTIGIFLATLDSKSRSLKNYFVYRRAYEWDLGATSRSVELLLFSLTQMGIYKLDVTLISFSVHVLNIVFAWSFY